MTPATAADSFAARLLNWHAHHGRHDLPWQHPRTPYRVWLSEVMLQQTQVAVVIPYFQRFVTALPTLAALAEAGDDAVLGLWSGLGYYSRARNLHKAAKLCMQLHDGELPRSFDALLALPGIGRSTAGAILSQAWGERSAILDGNVKRVLARYFGVEGWPGTPAVEKRLWALAESLLPDSNLPAWTQAQMDLGATLCTRARPACGLCPVQGDCVARIQGRTSELPTPRPAKASPQREAWVVWLEDAQGEVLMQRRPERGVWAKLYSLPQFDSHDATSTWLSMQAANVRIETLAPIEHAFSHYRLRLQPLRAVLATPHPAALRENDETCWVPRARLAQLGIPAPIRRLIEPTQLRSTRMSRTVFCQRLNRESEGLEFAPLPGELGQRIYQHTSRDAWGEWLAHQTMLINELRLSPRNPEHRARLEAELVKFLFEGGAKTPAGFVSA